MLYTTTLSLECQFAPCERLVFIMQKKLAKLLIVALILTMLPLSAAAAVDDKPLRVGLYYNSTTVVVSNLENAEGTGYAFGYYDTDRNFVKLGETQEQKISVMKTQNLYLTSGGIYVYESAGAAGVVGCYHVQLPGSYEDFESAKAVADSVTGGFVAWIAGTYYVRCGSYAGRTAAQEAANALGVEGTSVGETSAYGYSAVATGTTRILFQFDANQAGEAGAFGVQPGLEPDVKAITTFKGEKFYGGFRFERINGGDSTVVNIVGADDYVRGLLPYEMSPSWPLEALKAQALAAKNYALGKKVPGSNHDKVYHFDICTTTHCQVYHGVGRANDNTNRAVDEVAGKYIYYNGKLATQTVYSSSHGGASEDAKNIWGTDYGYLKGVIDPYEGDVADIAGNYKWTKTYTPQTLKERIQKYESSINIVGDIVNFTTKKSDTGNVISFTVTDSTGKNYTLSRHNVRGALNINSIHFDLTVSGGTASTAGYTIAERAGAVEDLTTQYAISGDGAVSAIPEGAYAITGDGVAKLEPAPGAVPATGGDVVYTLKGTGWGHSVGMSQWGAYAMAKRGMSYLDILKFYYTGITVE